VPAVENRRRRVGLLGGSFNPAHEGHLHISRLALDELGLDELWWLVSPQNPLKPAAGMAPAAERLAGARAVARDRRIVVTDIERELGTRYTVDTMAALKKRFPGHRFVWVAGADIMPELHRWKNWRRLFRTVAIAVFARPTYSFRVMSSIAARRFAAHRIPENRARRLAGMRLPAWVFLKTPVHPASATQIRKARAQAARKVAAG
jgi:nicotinate-nucleotide adenylyltransferase